MNISLKISYNLGVVMNGKRKAEEIRVFEAVDCKIPDLAEMKLVATVTDVDRDNSDPLRQEHYYHDGKQFWIVERGVDNLPMTVGHKIEVMQSGIYVKGSFGIDLYSDFDCPSRESVIQSARSFVTDDRDSALEKLNERELSRYGFYNGIVFKITEEPVYYGMTFGMGGNHGGTALLLGGISEAHRCSGSVFNLTQRSEAISRAEKIAIDRGDTKSLPIVKLMGLDVEIHDAAVFQLSPYRAELLKQGVISAASFVLNNPDGLEILERLYTEAWSDYRQHNFDCYLDELIRKVSRNIGKDELVLRLTGFNSLSRD
jgi:hypothetical protein